MTSRSPLSILALDHRSSLKRLMNSKSPDAVSEDKLIRFKEVALQTLLPLVSHVLVDPDYGLPALKEVQSVGNAYPPELPDSRFGRTNMRPSISPSVGIDTSSDGAGMSSFPSAHVGGAYMRPAKIILSIEKSGYVEQNGERLSRLLYSVKELKKMDAQIVKLLVYFNPAAGSAEAQKELVRKVSTDCKSYGLEFLLEPIAYRLNNNELFDPEIAALETANEISQLNCPIDIYKTDFPGKDSCRQLTEILGDTPWVLLSGGDDFDEYREQLKIAVAGGASGFAAGRAVWKDVVKYEENEWERFFQSVVKKRLEKIVELIS